MIQPLLAPLHSITEREEVPIVLANAPTRAMREPNCTLNVRKAGLGHERLGIHEDRFDWTKDCRLDWSCESSGCPVWLL